MTRHLFAVALIVLPAVAAAQTPAPPSSGPLVLERIENRFIVAPDFKVTDIDGDAGGLAGGYAGWLADDTLLVGGAAYWLANGPNDAELAYGGLLVGWNTPAEHRIQFGARGLVGFGRGRLGSDITTFARFGSRAGRTLPGPIPGFRDTRIPIVEPRTVRVLAQDDFFVFEPQLTVLTKLTNHIAVSLGAGYRLTAYTDFLDDRLRGVTGSVGVQWRP